MKKKHAKNKPIDLAKDLVMNSLTKEDLEFLEKNKVDLAKLIEEALEKELKKLFKKE